MNEPNHNPTIDPAAVRSARGWSQERMAEFLGCDQSTVSRIENGAPMNGPIKRLYEMIANGPASEITSEAAQ